MRRSGVSSLLSPSDDIPLSLSFSTISNSGSESIKTKKKLKKKFNFTLIKFILKNIGNLHLRTTNFLR